MTDDYYKENAVYFQRLEDKLDKLLESVQQLNVGQAEQAKDTVQLQKEMFDLQKDLEDQRKDHDSRIGELEKIQSLHKSHFRKMWTLTAGIIMAIAGAAVRLWMGQ